MRKFIFFVLAAASPFLHAQNQDSLRLNAEVRLQLDWEVGSNGITNAALFDFLSVSFINDELKDRLTENLRGSNGIGLVQDYEIGYRQWRDSTYSSWQKGFGIHYALRSRFGARISDKAVEMSLYGNAPFAGETVDLKPLANQSISYSEIGYELIRQKKNWHFEGSLNLLFGHTYAELQTDRATAFTQEDGEYIDLDAAYNFRSSDSLLLFKGMGGSIHAQFSYMMDRWQFGLSIRDLGIMQWGSGSWQVDADSTFRFEGQDIPNLFDNNDELLDGTQQRLENSFTGQEGGSFASWLPARIGANASYQLSSAGTLRSVRADVDHLFIPGYFPRSRFSANLQYGDQWLLIPELSYGGFVRFGGGISANWLHPHWQIGLSLNNVQGFVIPAASYGLGGQIRIAYRM